MAKQRECSSRSLLHPAAIAAAGRADGGLGVTDSARMVKLLQSCAAKSTTCWSSRQAAVVRAGRSHLGLVYCRVIASGARCRLRQNDECERAYLGDQHVVVSIADTDLL